MFNNPVRMNKIALAMQTKLARTFSKFEADSCFFLALIVNFYFSFLQEAKGTHLVGESSKIPIPIQMNIQTFIWH